MSGEGEERDGKEIPTSSASPLSSSQVSSPYVDSSSFLNLGNAEEGMYIFLHQFSIKRILVEKYNEDTPSSPKYFANSSDSGIISLLNVTCLNCRYQF